MVSNHHLSYHKQNILSRQDGGPICNVERGVEVLSASASVSPLPQPLPPHLDQLLPLSSQPQTVFLKGQRLPQQEARSPPWGCLSEPLLLPPRSHIRSLALLVVPAVSGPSLAGSGPVCPPLLPAPRSCLCRTAREPGDASSSAPLTCATQEATQPTPETAQGSLSYKINKTKFNK